MTRRGRFHDPELQLGLKRKLHQVAKDVDRKLCFMEVCGTHTHSIAEAGIRRMMPDNVKLTSGPGCPVCVTPIDYVDHAEALGERSDVIVCTFGDLIRVPSTRGSLEKARAQGSDIRVVYSPRDALTIAADNPDKKIVFLAVGFETTMPTIAAALAEAEMKGIDNFLLLPGAKLIEPPLRALIQDEEVNVDGFLLPGHVSVILGASFYRFLEEECHVPGAIVGFAPLDVLSGVIALVEQCRDGEARVENLYKRVVTDEGNAAAMALLDRFFVAADSRWRGLGEIPLSGLALTSPWSHRDASKLEVELPEPKEVKGCRCGDILRGVIEPPECPVYDKACTPERPMGACMVSSEGTCAAWYRHERLVTGTVK